VSTGEKHVISFGRGVRLMSEAYYIEELRGFGIDKPRAFRALCRSICCPIIVLGRVAFVDPAVFQVCIKHLSVPGSLDFNGPNSSMKPDRKRRPYMRTKVPAREVRRNWRLVVRAIIDSRRMVGLHSPPAERAAIKSAAAELTRFVLTMIPSGEQEQQDGQAVQPQA
jgi:hypothetical protein